MRAPPSVVAIALRALDTRGPEEVLDLVGDSDLDPTAPAQTRRLRFRRSGCQVDVLVQETIRPGQPSAGGDAVHVLLRVTPPSRCQVRAVVRGDELTVPVRSARTDGAGAVRLPAVPRGVTSFWVDDGSDLRRTAWVRL